jgi:hypothetical protein
MMPLRQRYCRAPLMPRHDITLLFMLIFDASRHAAMPFSAFDMPFTLRHTLPPLFRRYFMIAIFR